jgi:hypothetical protein
MISLKSKVFALFCINAHVFIQMCAFFLGLVRPCEGSRQTMRRVSSDHAKGLVRPCKGSRQTIQSVSSDHAKGLVRPCKGSRQTMQRVSSDHAKGLVRLCKGSRQTMQRVSSDYAKGLVRLCKGSRQTFFCHSAGIFIVCVVLEVHLALLPRVLSFSRNLYCLCCPRSTPNVAATSFVLTSFVIQ